MKITDISISNKLNYRILSSILIFYIFITPMSIVADYLSTASNSLNKSLKQSTRALNSYANTFVNQPYQEYVQSALSTTKNVAENGLNYTYDIVFDKIQTALHEGGHAILAILYGINDINKATIEFSDKPGGKKMNISRVLRNQITMKPIVGGSVSYNSSGIFNRAQFSPDTTIEERIAIMNYNEFQRCYISVIVSLGGIVAEQIFGAYSDLVPHDFAKLIFSDKRATSHKDILNITSNAHGKFDLQNIKNDLSRYFKPAEYNNVIVQCYTIAYRMLRKYKKELKMIANLLIKKRTVSGDEILKLLELEKPVVVMSSNTYPKELIQSDVYYVTTPTSYSYPNFTGVNIEISTIYSDEYLEQRKAK
ncbi:MAG: hypothetical protein Q8Q60_02435 [Candidatus Chromulinivorax sp.]|nr:hypothetical protein [Candidatus Chromulinivorax sp.]